MNTADVNRGYIKIEGAVRAFNFDFKDKVVLDIGSSTGGFTEIALEKGAKKVIAVEKGTNQMKTPLRFDPRIDLHEKTDIFDVRATNTSFEDRRLGRSLKAHEVTPRSVSENEVFVALPDVIVADVSFLSLTKILEHAKNHLADRHTEFLVMFKPQFEAAPHQLNKGVVKNEKIRREIIKNFEFWLKTNNFLIINKRDNDLRGKTGNLERFYYLKLSH
ncbi:hypothetical protein IJJ36_02680 [Candidatus Saccharibacteria bacterium]|nr:hypothetical protein [Candidatus Saccharibacteria bacterium]